jgi:hypothetical protein
MIYVLDNVGPFPFAEIHATACRGRMEVDTVTGPGICDKANRRLAMKHLERRGVIMRAASGSQWIVKGVTP